MNDETKAAMNDLLDLLEDNDYSVTSIDVVEYGRGDPTAEDYTETGAEIDVTAYISFDAASDEDNPFRVK